VIGPGEQRLQALGQRVEVDADPAVEGRSRISRLGPRHATREGHLGDSQKEVPVDLGARKEDLWELGLKPSSGNVGAEGRKSSTQRQREANGAAYGLSARHGYRLSQGPSGSNFLPPRRHGPTTLRGAKPERSVRLTQVPGDLANC
jgi:hypothetical protein